MNNSESFNFKSLIIDKIEIGNPQQKIAEHLQHWRCHSDDNKVQWWCLDKHDSSTNTLSQAVITELGELVANVKNKRRSNPVTAVVIRSIKTNGFIAGAEISEFRNQQDPAQVQDKLKQAQAILFDLESLNIPTIAVVHGFCLGGGLELALACQYRFARNDTKLGFPEVNLGLHPGLGGSVRLPQQISAPEALKIILSGKSIGAQKAYKLGLVDAIGEERHVANAVLQTSKKDLPHRGQSTKTRLLNHRPVINVVTQQAKKQTESKISRKHYPAPFALLDIYRKYGHEPEAMYKAERRSFAQLLCSEKAQNLIRVFFLREQLKNEADQDSPPIEHVHVVGGSAMGGDIASWCALQGLRVTLEDTAPENLSKAFKRAQTLFSKKIHDQRERQQIADKFIPDLSGHGRRRADLIIEAVPEKMDLKSKVLRELEKDLKQTAILATNTSSLLLQRLSENLQQPSRLVGIHFFNPVAKMPLVEIVTHDQLLDDISNRASSFIGAIKKLPVVVKSSPGFLVNRVLTPYLLEALALIDEGEDKEVIDQAAEEFGMPMGPIELSDFIGLDICLHVAESLAKELETPMYQPPTWFKDMVAADELGLKTDKGFYRYNAKGEADKKKVDALSQAKRQQLQDRLFLPFLNTCAQCLQEGIVADRDQLDAAIIFATGFPPFTGGPMHYAQNLGVNYVTEKLSKLNRQIGERFQPSSYWQGFEQQQTKTSDRYETHPDVA
jgi:3-hydroxyacyl-CoA dehydrogenase/enoyl-CoA hydratase/3-hydroxybutyryl-CoA epimerase